MRPLNSLTKRDLLAAKKFDADEVRLYAEEHFEAERLGDAFELFAKIKDRDGVTKIRDLAIRQGDPEVLWRIAHREPDLVSKSDWETCGKSAMHMKKHRSALFAFQRAGNEELVTQAEKAVNPDAAPPQPPPAPDQE